MSVFAHVLCAAMSVQTSIHPLVCSAEASQQNPLWLSRADWSCRSTSCGRRLLLADLLLQSSVTQPTCLHATGHDLPMLQVAVGAFMYLARQVLIQSGSSGFAQPVSSLAVINWRSETPSTESKGPLYFGGSWCYWCCWGELGGAPACL